MDEFKVKIPQLRNAVSQENDISRELGALRDELYNVKQSLRFKIAQRERINTRLKTEREAVNGQTTKMKRLSGKLSDIADLYERTELELSGKGVPKGGNKLPEWLLPYASGDLQAVIKVLPWLLPGMVPGISFYRPSKVTSIVDFLLDNTTFDGYMGDVTTTGTEWKTKNKGNFSTDSINDINEELKQKTKDWNKAHGLDTKVPGSIKGEYDHNTGKWMPVDQNNPDAVKAFNDEMKRQKMEGSVKVAGVSSVVSAAFLTGEATAGDKSKTHASAKVEVGKAEAYAEAYAGLYQVDPASGKRIFKPGVGGRVGATATAFTATEEAQLGDSNLGVYVKSTQSAGRVGATAAFAAGGIEGGAVTALYAGARAEAIAGEITGTAGAKVLGTDVGISGSLNYGIGAHADVGIKDGKFSIDIGATVGVGASVKLEIDVSGTVNAICGGAKAAWAAITGF